MTEVYREIVRGIYKRLLSFLDRNLSFEIQPNGVYTKHDVLKPVIRAEAENTFIESACRRLGAVSSDTVFYHLGKLSLREITECLKGGIEDSFARTRKKHRITGDIDIAVDVHEIPYHGKDQNIFVLGGKRKSGTNTFYKVITVCIVSKGRRYTLAVIPVCFFDITVKLLEQLIQVAQTYVTIRSVLLDRGFLSVDTINKLYGLEMPFVMPIRKNDAIRHLLKRCFLEDVDRVTYTMRSGSKKAAFDLVVYATGDDIVGFATNIPGTPRRIAGRYRKRWGIETSYRVKNRFFGRTCSRKPKIRLLFIMLSFLLYNLWVLANRMLGCRGLHVTAGDMCVYVVTLMESGIP